MAATDVKFIISVEEAGAIRKLTETERALYDLQGTAKKADSSFKQLFGTFTLASLAASGIQRLFSGITSSISDGIKGAIEEERSQRRLITALEMSGRAHSGNIPTMLAFAQAQSQLTLYTHEEIESVETLFATMTKLDVLGIQRATKGAMGLASVMGTDLFSAASKMLNVIEGNSSALRGTGIVLDDNLPKHEKLEQLLERTVPLWQRAAAETGSYGGKISQFTKSWNEFKEALGKEFIEATDLPGILGDYTKYLNSFDDSSKRAKLSWSDLMVSMFGSTAIGAIAGAAAATLTVADNTGTLSNKLRILMSDPKNAPGPFWTATADALAKTKSELINTDAVYGRMTTHYQMLLQAQREMQNLNYVGTFEPRLDTAMPESYTQWLDAQKTFAKEATSEVKDFYEGSRDYSAEFYQDITRGFTSAFMKFKLSTQGFADFFVATWQAIKQAFFQILADMLARWLTMAFVRGILNLLTLGSGGSFFGSGNAGAIGMASGFHGIIQKPTLALIGEAGPERVDVGPVNSRGGGGGTTNINVSIYALDNSDMERAVRQRVVPILKEVYAHGGL